MNAITAATYRELRQGIRPVALARSLGYRIDPEQYQQFVKHYGPGWTAMHHYCWGLMEMGRAARPNFSREQRASHAAGALREIDYVLRNSPRDFVMRPMVLSRRARFLLQIGQPADAASTARALIDEWPRFADGYPLLAEALLKLGKRDEAGRVLSQGEAAVEDQERFRQLKSLVPLK